MVCWRRTSAFNYLGVNAEGGGTQAIWQCTEQAAGHHSLPDNVPNQARASQRLAAGAAAAHSNATERLEDDASFYEGITTSLQLKAPNTADDTTRPPTTLRLRLLRSRRAALLHKPMRAPEAAADTAP